MKSPVCTCFLVLFAVSAVFSVNNLREEFTWTRIDYDWNSNNNNRRTRDVEIEDRYGYSGGHGATTKRPQSGHQQELYFPDSAPGYNSGDRPGSGFRPGTRKPTVKPYRPQSQNYGEETQNQGSSGQSQNSYGLQSGSQTRENYIYQNNIPMGAGVWGDKLFITVPRRRHGVPSTLNYVSLSSQNKHNTPLIPYPNWEMNALPENYNSSNFDSSSVSSNDRQHFVSVYRVAVDPCDRLWFVDIGRLEIPDAPIEVQSPKLVVMDLRTDRVIRQYTFPESDLRPASLFAHVVVEADQNDCSNAYAYMADVGGYGLVVYSYKENRSWRVTHNYFYLEPLRGEFRIAGHTFQWNDGVFSTALSPARNGRRHLYFHSMAGSNMYRVPTDVLKNQTAATRSYHGQDFENLGDRGEGSQTSASALDVNTGVLLLGLVNQNALACWNINTPLTDISIVQKDDQKMIYPCDLKVYNDNLYLLTNTMPGFLYGQLDYNIVNFRVWVQSVREAIKGTNCEAGSGNSYGGSGNSFGGSGNSYGGSGGSRRGNNGNRYTTSDNRGGSHIDYASRGSYMG